MQRFDGDLVLRAQVQGLHGAAGTQRLVAAGLLELGKLPTPDSSEEVMRRRCSLRVGPTHVLVLVDSAEPASTAQAAPTPITPVAIATGLSQSRLIQQQERQQPEETDRQETETETGDKRVPVCLRRPQQSDAALSVHLDLTLCPLDGAFEAFAEETLEDVEKKNIRRTLT